MQKLSYEIQQANKWLIWLNNSSLSFSLSHSIDKLDGFLEISFARYRCGKCFRECVKVRIEIMRNLIYVLINDAFQPCTNQSFVCLLIFFLSLLSWLIKDQSETQKKIIKIIESKLKNFQWIRFLTLFCDIQSKQKVRKFKNNII